MVMEDVLSPQCVGREFVRNYYTYLNEAPQDLYKFYYHDSSFVHGGLKERLPEKVHGQQQIQQKIMELDFHDCKAKILLVDYHRTLENGVVVQVFGELSNKGQPMRRFVQTFVLAPRPQSAKEYYVRNDIFRYQDDAFFDDEDGVEDRPVENENEVQQPRPAPVEVNHAPVAPVVVPQPTVQQTELTAGHAIGMNGTDEHVEEEIRQRKKIRPNKYSLAPKHLNSKDKQALQRKENELKEILISYMPSNNRSPRKMCYPGDGREHGIYFACLYRFLQCNFTLAPNHNDVNEENCEEFGICTKKKHKDYYPFIELMNIVKDIPDIASRTGQLHRLPPSLGTLIGYRGLVLQRDYLQSSASRPFVASQNNATITELEDEDDSDDEDISYPRRKPDEITFGDKKADSLLRSRLMTLFFWPAVMSSMCVPDLTKEDPTPEVAEVHPKSPAPGKRQVKKAKYDNICQVVLNRHGKCRPKKNSAAAAMPSKSLAEKKKVQPRRKKIVPKSDRVTRGCKKRVV